MDTIRAVTVGVLLAAIDAGCAGGRTEPPELAPGQPAKGGTVMVAAIESPYGFRYDPMKFVADSDTPEAAIVRRVVFGAFTDGDVGLLGKRIDEVFAAVNDDGTLAEGHSLLHLALLGAEADDPRVRKPTPAGSIWPLPSRTRLNCA